MAARRLALVVPGGCDPWRRYNLEQGFLGVAAQFAAAGWRVDLVGEFASDAAFSPAILRRDLPPPDLPLVASPGSEAVTEGLRTGHRLWHALRSDPVDMVIAPLRGGIVQPSLMGRALGELPAQMRFLCWADAPTADRAGLDDPDALVARLVDDALERQCVRLADALLGPGGAALDRVRLIGAPADRCIVATLPAWEAGAERPATPRGRSVEMLVAGPGSRAYGADIALAGLESGRIAVPQGCRVVFAGPWRDGGGLSKHLLGMRAAGWRFDFEMWEDATPAAIVERAGRPETTTLFMGAHADDEVMVERIVRSGGRVLLGDGHRLAERLRGFVEAPASIADDAGPLAPRDDDWPAVLAGLSRTQPVVKADVDAGVSVCITHRDRPVELARAVASVSAGVEVVIADTGSVSAGAADTLDSLARERLATRIIRLEGATQGNACDAAAAASTGRFILFLDDDNAYADGGCDRLVRAIAASKFAIVVTNLLLHDGLPHETSPVAKQIFLGAAGTAGLFFNGFGDTSFAIRRTAFSRVGGFGDYDGPALDWVFLARAHAAGLPIGVLQDPAVAYRRDIDARHGRWRKQDRATALAAVHSALAGHCDPAIIIAAAQRYLGDALSS